MKKLYVYEIAEICVATIIMVLIISFELFAVFKCLTHKGKVSEITKIKSYNDII